MLYFADYYSFGVFIVNIFKLMLFSYNIEFSRKLCFSFSDVDSFLSGKEPESSPVSDILFSGGLEVLISDIFSQPNMKNFYENHNTTIYTFLYGRDHNKQPDNEKIQIIDSIKQLKTLIDTFSVLSLSSISNSDLSKLNEQIIENIMNIGGTLGLENHYIATQLYLLNMKSQRKMPIAYYLLNKDYLRYDSFIDLNDSIEYKSDNSHNAIKIHLMNPLYIAAYYNDYETLDKLLDKASAFLGKDSVICNNNYNSSTNQFNNFGIYDARYKEDVFQHYCTLKEHFEAYNHNLEKSDNKKSGIDLIKSGQACFHKPSLLNMDILVLLAFTFIEYDNKKNFVDAEMSIKMKSLFEKHGYHFSKEKENIILNYALTRHNVSSFENWNWQINQNKPLLSLITTDKFILKYMRYGSSGFVENKKELFTKKISEISHYLNDLNDEAYVDILKTMAKKTNTKRLISEIDSYSHESQFDNDFMQTNINNLLDTFLLIKQHTESKWAKNHSATEEIITDLCKPLFSIKPNTRISDGKGILSERNILDFQMILRKKIQAFDNNANIENKILKNPRI